MPVARSKAGFTLVEILIVVAIVGILVAIAVPAFLRASRTSRVTSSQKNMTAIDGAVQQYILNFDLTDTGQFIDLHGTVVADWEDPEVVGSGGLLRTAPSCPAGGTYFITDWDADPTQEPVVNVIDPKIYFPGYEPDDD